MIQTPQTLSRSPFLAAVITCLLSITFHIAAWTAWQTIPADPPKPIIPPPEVIEVALMKAPANKPAPPAPPQIAKPINKTKELPKPQKPKTPEKPKTQPKAKPKVETKSVPKPTPEEKVVETPSPTAPISHAEQAPTPIANAVTSGKAVPAPVKSLASAPETFEKAGYTSANLNNPPTRYPAIARQRHWEGKVLLEVRVLANGSASDVKVVQSSGHELLDDSAVEQVKAWHFTPARRGNKTVDDWVRVPITFKFKD
jgi:protein TonB